MNEKRAKLLRKVLRERGTPADRTEYHPINEHDKTVVMSPCGRSHYRNVKKMYRKFGL